MALRTAQVAAPVLDQPVFAKLTAFVETVDAGPSGGRMVLVITGMETAFAVTKPERLRVTFKGQGPRAGEHVAGQARLMPPPQPAFPGGYDFARDAWFLGLGAVGRWVGPMTSTPAPRSLGFGLAITAAIDNARTDMTNRIARIVGGQAGRFPPRWSRASAGCWRSGSTTISGRRASTTSSRSPACTWCWRPASSSGWRGRCWR